MEKNINKNSTIKFFTCWLPLSNLNFFHPRSSSNQKFTEGAVQRVLDVIQKLNNFSMEEESEAQLFLNSSHYYFLDKRKKYLEDLPLKETNIITKDITISYLKVNVIYKKDNISVTFTFTFDEYGFYFFESNENLTKEIVSEFFGGDFFYDSSIDNTHGEGDTQLEKYDGILTKNQLVLLLEGVMNCDLYYKYFCNHSAPKQEIW